MFDYSNPIIKQSRIGDKIICKELLSISYCVKKHFGHIGQVEFDNFFDNSIVFEKPVTICLVLPNKVTLCFILQTDCMSDILVLVVALSTNMDSVPTNALRCGHGFHEGKFYVYILIVHYCTIAEDFMIEYLIGSSAAMVKNYNQLAKQYATLSYHRCHQIVFYKLKLKLHLIFRIFLSNLYLYFLTIFEE